MSYTEQDVHEGRRLMDDGRQNRLVIGDKLLSVTAQGSDRDCERYCDAISLHPNTGRTYRHTARICTPPVRQLVADSGVHVSYSVLREGARLAPSGKPYDESYKRLRAMLTEAREAGAGRILLAQYQQALGTGPALQDLLDPAQETSLSQYLGTLLPDNPAERAKLLKDLVEEQADFCEGVKQAMDDKRRRDRENRIDCPGDKPSKGQALARDAVRMRDQAVAFMNRYPRAVAFTDDQRAACEEALGTLEVLAMFLKLRLGNEAAAASGQRAEPRNLVTV
ncbi:hypothetical protein AB0I84_04595 [Streptomyces spectabilis]|uniref:hypothetical protein n=1 Tax=Streptomyces spectabilis TaxID=68270 RepID=UPI0033DF946E